MRTLPWFPSWVWILFAIALGGLVSWLLLTFLRTCDEDLCKPQGRVIPGRIARKRAA
jgi:hypothetical protein